MIIGDVFERFAQDSSLSVMARGLMENALSPPLPSAASQPAWHLGQARECEVARAWPAAVFHLSRLIDTQPEQRPLRERRGRAYAELGRWDQAAADYARALELGTKEDDLEGIAYQLSYLRVHLGDLDGYRRTCADLLERFKRTKNPRSAYLLARICGLAPDGVADPADPVRLAERAVAANPKAGWYLHTLALAHYRAGQFDEAIRQARRSMEAHPGWNAHVVDWLVLAMAHHQLGHAEEARQWLDKAVQWPAKAHREMPKDAAGALPLHPHDWLACQLLRREAEVLLKEENPHQVPAEGESTVSFEYEFGSGIAARQSRGWVDPEGLWQGKEWSKEVQIRLKERE